MSRFKPATTDVTVGQRVQLHPSCDAWMRGVRYGTVHVIGSKHVHVLWDATGKVGAVRPEFVSAI